MPTFSRSLEQSLHRALALANERHHEYATLEHLLLSLTEDQDAASALRGCGVDLERLRKELTDYIDASLDQLVTGASGDSKPTTGFQRTIQRAILRGPSSGRETTGADALVTLFSEADSAAVELLKRHGMTVGRALDYIGQGKALGGGQSG